MSRTKRILVTGAAVIGLLSVMGSAGANPVDRLCDGPRDGKAVWYRILCE